MIEHVRSLTLRDRVVLAAFSLVLLLPGTFGVSLVDRDEGWHAQVCREMLDSGDWLVPTYLGAPWLAKPPLLYWGVIASYSLFGVTAAAARLVPVLAMTGVVQLVATLAATMFNRRVALTAAIGFLTAGLPLVVGKMLLTDALMWLCCMGAIVLLWRIATDHVSTGRCIAFWLCVGLGILANGPAVLVFVGSFGLAMRFGPAGWRWMYNGRLWATAIVAPLVAAPWYAYTAMHEGGTLSQQFLWYEIFSRIAGTPHGHSGPPGYYLLLSLAGWLPWTALVPGAVILAWQARSTSPEARVLLIWCFLPWIILELIHSKLPHYIVPCYIPLALMLGRMWDSTLDRRADTTKPPRAERTVFGIWVFTPVAIGVGAIAAAIYWREMTWALSVAVAGGVLIVGFLIVGYLTRRNDPEAVWAGAVGCIGLFHIVVGLWVLPEFEPYRLSRIVAERANAVAPAGARVAVCGYEEPSVFFYLHEPARVIATDELAQRFHKADATAVLIAREQDWRDAGIAPGGAGAEWFSVSGFNYVKGLRVTLWIARREPQADAADG
ncbi:MAG: glycosyltransferase family 39 protein [Phycisphaerae bacterium]|nr:glycosyltransferase family 39 protein [Phycisphaerae bacterium]